PEGLAIGPHIVRVVGATSGSTGRAVFQLQPPTIQLDAYTGKPTQTFSLSGSGFVPGEQVDVYLGHAAGQLLTTVTADSRGQVSARNTTIPRVDAGDYTVVAIG